MKLVGMEKDELRCSAAAKAAGLGKLHIAHVLFHGAVGLCYSVVLKKGLVQPFLTLSLSPAKAVGWLERGAELARAANATQLGKRGGIQGVPEGKLYRVDNCDEGPPSLVHVPFISQPRPTPFQWWIDRRAC